MLHITHCMKNMPGEGKLVVAKLSLVAHIKCNMFIVLCICSVLYFTHRLFACDIDTDVK